APGSAPPERMMVLVLLLLSILPRPGASRETCDVIELNHFYNELGQPVFDQILFWEWSGSRYDVRAWRLVQQPEQLPRRDWRGGGFVALWSDGPALQPTATPPLREVFREVHAPSFRETWTQHDPELEERQFLPVQLRRGLKGER
ncbi:MAG TPA: hypothetical protein VFV87_01210, partial [Pirellulaceae bacterium]|nr:hypothetical protein [Pirellulaceae bacterium]